MSDGELLRHQAFVRQLARGLVRDAARADDLVQEAWVQALERPPRVATAARAWFRTVLQNLARRSAREDIRRRTREDSVARREAEPSGQDIGARLALEQELVQAVEGLREPYRTVVFQRYFEDLSPGAIASREGVPVATVKTRLRRALELLRESLDRGRGRQAWTLALVRLAGARTPVPILAPLLGAGLVLAGVSAWLLPGSPTGRGARPGELPGVPEAAEPRRTATELSAPQTPPEDLDVRREPVAAKGPAPDEETPGAVSAPGEEARPGTGLVLEGRVLFEDLRGAAGAGVVFGPFRTVSDARGAFALELAPDDVLSTWPGLPDAYTFSADTALVAYLDGWVPAVEAGFGARVMQLLREEARTAPPLELVLGGPALKLAGTVVERTGLAGEGWRIALLDGTPAHRDDYRPFTVEELASGTSTHVETGADGRFLFRCLEAGRGYRVRAWNPRTLEQLVSEPTPAGTTDLELRAPSEGWRPLVEGVVVGLDDLPIPDVRCRLSMNEYRTEQGAWMNSGQTVTTDALGRFAFVDVPPAEIFIRYGDSQASGRHDLAPDERSLRLVLVRRGELLFEVQDWRRAPDTLSVLDESGERLSLERDLAPGRSSSSHELRIADDGTARARVSERACWLVLMRSGQELVRLPLTVRHGENTLVRW